MIQYRYAFNAGGLLVDCMRLNEANRGDFKCPSCGESLRLVLPTADISKHFRHARDTICTGESYLHRAAKQAFKQGYEYHAARDGYFLVGREPLKISDVFTRLDIEHRDTASIPDITLSDNANRKLFVEIAVTHRIDWRSAQMRWYPTLEIDIANESDIERLKDARVNLLASNVRLYDNGLDCREYLTAKYYLSRDQWGYVKRYGERLRDPDLGAPSVLCALLELGVLSNDQQINRAKLEWILEVYHDRQE